MQSFSAINKGLWQKRGIEWTGIKSTGKVVRLILAFDREERMVLFHIELTVFGEEDGQNQVPHIIN